MTAPPADLDTLLAAGARDDVLALTEGMDQAHAQYVRGVALFQLGRFAEAVASLARSGADPVHAYWSNHWRGRAHQALNNPVEAAGAYRAAARAHDDPGNAALYIDAALTALASDAPAHVRGQVAAELGDFWRERAAGSPAPAPDIAALADRLAASERSAQALLERVRDLESLDPTVAPYTLATGHPVAIHSDDHRHPRGTAVDNTRSPRFVRACERHFAHPLAALDLGCAGGGLVRDFILRGHRAVGLEGSDVSLLNQRAEWRTIPSHLHTCDILQPFGLSDASGEAALFDVITAWEVLEHLPREALPGFFANVRRHLAEEGLFVASVALFEDRDPVSGAVWHVTLEPQAWWEAQLAQAGLRAIASPFAPKDYVRGSGNGPIDWDGALRPDLGFHIVAMRDGAAAS